MEGLRTVSSTFGVQETMGRLESAVTAKGMTVFVRIDHAVGAEEAGLALRPTQVLIFGSARGGTPMMQAKQTVGIDLPLKALVWEDSAGAVWLSYNDPLWIASRHGVGAQVEAMATGMASVLEAISKIATQAG